MIRTQVYLTEDLVQGIKLATYRRGQAEAAVIRDLIRIGLKKEQPKQNAGAAFLEFAKHAVPGPKDLASNMFEYLYGEKSDYAAKKRKRIIK